MALMDLTLEGWKSSTMIHGAPYVMMMAHGQTTITEWHAGTLCSESLV